MFSFKRWQGSEAHCLKDWRRHILSLQLNKTWMCTSQAMALKLQPKAGNQRLGAWFPTGTG